MKWVKASERLPDNPKRERPIKESNLYWIAWYSEERKRWLTDYDQSFENENVEWLDETQPEQNRGQEESVNVPPYQTELDMTGIINGEKSIAELDEILREFYTENKQEYGESFGRAIIHDIIRIVSKSQRMLYEDEAIRFFNWVQLNVDEKFNYTTPQLYQLFKKTKK